MVATLTTLAEIDDFVTSLDAAQSLPAEQRQALLEAFVRVVEPEIDPSWSYIVLSPGGSGVSRKPGHITLNWRRMFDVGPDVTVAGLGAASDAPYVHVLVGLYIWNKVWRGMEEELTEDEASVIEALWSEPASSVARADLFASANQTRTARGLPVLTEGQFARAVDRLVEMRCIKIKEGGAIWRREWVRKRT